ncbi:MAG: zinc ABC transporter substrate-binding protein [Firmicutes bacterium]|nr:zinc ABC transporter substrate-binding protein [Bacillota bacterium]
MRDRKKKTGAKYRAALGIFAGAALLALTAGCRIGQDIEPESVIMDGKGGQNAQEEETDGAEERLQVMASFYTMADFAEKIGGSQADVTCMVPTGTEPHDWEPSTTDITGLERADVFIYNGAGMEHWAEDVAESLENQKLLVVEASDGIALQEEASHAGHSHSHGGYDPHVWLDPQNAKLEMENIKNAFVQADPDNGAYYEANYEKWAKKADELDQKYRKALAPFEGRQVVTAHEAYGYLCSAYGLEQLGIDGLSPDSEPNPRRMADIIDFVREHQIRAVFFEELSGSKTAETVAAETGIELLALSPLEGLSDEELAAGDDYFSVMEKNLGQLLLALGREAE